MPYTGGTPPQLDAIIPSTNWLAWLNRDWTTLNTLSPESTSTAVGAVYLEKTFTVVGELWMVVLW